MPKRSQSKRNSQKLLQPALERAAEKPNEAASEPLSLGDKIKGLFSSPTPSPKAADSSVGSASSSTPTSSALPVETERQLSEVPDTVGDDSPGSGEPGAVVTADEAEGDATNEERIAALVSLGYVDANQAGRMAEAAFDKVAVIFKSEHWKLPKENRDNIAKPLAACINSCIQKVLSKLPEAVGNKVSEHPEWVALGTALGSHVMPCTVQQLFIKPSKPDGPKVVTIKDSKPSPVVTGAAGPLGNIPSTSGTIS